MYIYIYIYIYIDTYSIDVGEPRVCVFRVFLVVNPITNDISVGLCSLALVLIKFNDLNDHMPDHRQVLALYEYFPCRASSCPIIANMYILVMLSDLGLLSA
jgi:hypothetical protein